LAVADYGWHLIARPQSIMESVLFLPLERARGTAQFRDSRCIPSPATRHNQSSLARLLESVFAWFGANT